jgi:poly(hydroxyalkanoate) depolymerase family esterase
MFILIRTLFQSVFANDLVQIENFGDNPGNLKMFFHAGKNINPTETHPLVVVLHGCTQRARRISVETGWNKLADTCGFNVIYAQQKPANNPNRCFNWYCKSDNSKDKGEVASIKSMIDYMIKYYKVDTNRIFIYGVSAGAAMASAMMACYPDLFNAGCIVAGGPYIKGVELSEALDAMKNPRNLTSEEWGNFVKSQNADYTGKYPRLIVIHGANDKVVNIDNAYNLIYQWTNLHKIDTIPDKDDSGFPKYNTMERSIYKNKNGETVITFYKFLKLGHQLPICPGSKMNQGGQLDLFAVKCDFHSTYQVAVDFGIIK